MDRNSVYKLAKFISNKAYPPEKLQSSWPDFLRMIGVTHAQAIQSIENALDDPGEDLGLSYEELIRLAKFLNTKQIRRIIYNRKIPPTEQEKHPELAEVAAAPAATSFTSTQNTAPYAVPLGDTMLRRQWWKKKKKAKKK